MARRLLATAVVAIGFLGTAQASSPEDWVALHSGRLMSSLDRDPTAAVSVYEAVIDHLDEDDPLRADYLYWLGRAWFESGDAAQAVEILSEVDGRSSVGTAARNFRGRLQLSRHVVAKLPATITARTEPMPLIPGWSAHTPPLDVVRHGMPHLSWPVASDAGRANFLAVGLSPEVGRLSSVMIEARSTEVALAVRIVVETWSGGAWVGTPQVLRPGMWTEVTANPDTLRPQRTTDVRLDPSQVGMVAIEIVPVDPGAMSSSARLQIKRMALKGS